MYRLASVALVLLFGLGLVATGQEKKPATGEKKKPVPAANADKPAAGTAQDAPADAHGNAEIDAISDTLRAYRAAFNKHDAQAMAELWSAEGVYTDRETGARFTGREAIAADLAAAFQERPDVQLTASVSGIRFIRPDVASVEGEASSSVPGEEPGVMSFTAILVKQDGKWLLDSIEESEPAVPETPYEALKELDWMVGHWVDDSDEAVVDTTVRWSRNQSFLIRSYSIELHSEDPREGTQVIGWDPIERRIRSWMFNSDGSFGEGSWFKDGANWMSRMSLTMADGSLASGTQVFTRTDNDTYRVESIGREIDGAPVPSVGPVTVVRVVEQAAANDGPNN
jgi:uncharacterized protein (TIGR02246 family)